MFTLNKAFNVQVSLAFNPPAITEYKPSVTIILPSSYPVVIGGLFLFFW